MWRSTGRSKEGQASIEFVILFILFLVAITFAMVVSINRSHVISNAQQDLEVNRVLGSMTSKINIAYLEGDGFSMNVTLPDRILREDYTVEVSSNEVVVRFLTRTYVEYILTTNVTGTFSKGTNTIANRNGTIEITG